MTKQKAPQAYIDYLRKDVQKRLDADIITEKEALKELEEARLRARNPLYAEPEHVQTTRNLGLTKKV